MDSFPHAPFRSFSTTSAVSVNLSTLSISRVASGPMLALNMSMNRVSNADDHMFYKCKVLLNRLAKIDGMAPYMSAAYAAAERCAEQQALALSQLLQQTESPTAFRSSMGSGGFSIYLDHLGASQPVLSAPLTNNIFTFTAGVLPTNMTVDPATQLWKLYQQGTPLCLVFNQICPLDPIPIVRGDDLRMCKKAVYDFVVAVKTHLNIDDDSMFTISNVFSDNTHDLLKIVKVVTRLLDSNNINTTDADAAEDLTADIAELKITDERSKVFRELLQTERKYILDLELLMQYKAELQNADALSSEQLHVLFPNLSDIVDFHRRLLSGLECNINVPSNFQRIGSVFIHASNGPFRAYEPWTIGQIAAIELLNKESPNLKKASSLLDPGFELQSYIIKPIQRLCKYPLLLKELIKTYSDSVDAPYYNELLMASAAMKEVANQVNEAQRRAENIGFLQNLVDRVKNWRGFNFKEQGDLLFHSVVAVKDGDSEKEYVAYLFEKIIFFLVELNPVDPKQKEKKKREILSSRKKSNSNVSGSTANLLENLNGLRENNSPLELKGRVYISEIYNVSSANLLGYTLVISWSGKKESGSFSLRFRTEETRNQWEACLRHLKSNEMSNQMQRRLRDSHGSLGTDYSYETPTYVNGLPMNQTIHESVKKSPSGDSYQRHNSSSSTFSMMKFGKNARVSGSSLTNGQSQSDTSTSSAALNMTVRIKVFYNKLELEEPLHVAPTVLFNELQLKISAKVAASGKEDVVINKLKYKDEEGDFVVMDSTDDWQLAVDMVEEIAEETDADRLLTIWAS